MNKNTKSILTWGALLALAYYLFNMYKAKKG